MDHPNIKNSPRKLFAVDCPQRGDSKKFLGALGVECETVTPSGFSQGNELQGSSLVVATLNGDISFLESLYKTFEGRAGLLVCAITEEALTTSAIELLTEIISLSEVVVLDSKNLRSLTGITINSKSDLELVGTELIKYGAKSFLILCDDLSGSGYQSALFCDSGGSCGLTSEKAPVGCDAKSASALATAVAGSMSLGLDVRDSVVLGMSVYNNSLHTGDSVVRQSDLPWINGSIEDGEQLYKFPKLEPAARVYPIVDSSKWVERLVTLGVKTLQLRIKNLSAKELEDEIKKSIEIARSSGARLFINDYWELALEHSAYGVHLGQEDLLSADLRAIEKGGLRLGVSTHCYFEAGVAHGLRPSYIAFGPIYHTELKSMDFAPQGIGNLKTWAKLFDYPLVAIGGITLERAGEVLEGKPDYISVVRDITLSKNPEERVKSWLEK